MDGDPGWATSFGQKRHKPGLQGTFPARAVSVTTAQPSRQRVSIQTCLRSSKAPSSGSSLPRPSSPAPEGRRPFTLSDLSLITCRQSGAFKDPPRTNPRTQPSRGPAGAACVGKRQRGQWTREVSEERGLAFAGMPCSPAPYGGGGVLLLWAGDFTYIPHPSLLGPSSPLPGIHVGLAIRTTTPSSPLRPLCVGVGARAW